MKTENILVCQDNVNISPVILLARVIFLFQVFHSLCSLTNLLLSAVSVPLNQSQLHLFFPPVLLFTFLPPLHLLPQPLFSLKHPCGASLLCEGSLVPLGVITEAQRNVQDHSKSDAFRCSLFLNPRPGKPQLGDSDAGKVPSWLYFTPAFLPAC